MAIFLRHQSKLKGVIFDNVTLKSSKFQGKITKSVEEKITEIKSRNQEEGSPLKTRSVKDSKDNSSVSDSEDLSESSISRTCGIVSTTEGRCLNGSDQKIFV